MVYLITAFALWKFEAGYQWWIAYVAVVALQAYSLFRNAKKAVEPLLKENGLPYTKEDLEFIWKHGYQSAVENINSTKQ